MNTTTLDEEEDDEAVLSTMERKKTAFEIPSF